MMPKIHSSQSSTKVDTTLYDNKSLDFYIKTRHWLSNPTKSFFKLFGQFVESENRIQISPQTIPGDIYEDKIILIQQFYINNNVQRHNENKLCLSLNVKNKYIDKIILLNERIYTEKELGIQSLKIKQINIGQRLTYKGVFDYLSSANIKGYIILANTDIFFDQTLNHVKVSGLHKERKVYCQLRHEYNNEQILNSCKLYYNRPDNQDTWIWHTNSIVTQKQGEIFNYQMGKNGCDNKTIYVFGILGFACHNEPIFIKTYHYHISQIRNYLSKGKVPGPYYSIHPYISHMPPANKLHTFDIVRENDSLREYISLKLKSGNPFIIPRIAGVENETALSGVFIKNNNVNKRLLTLIKKQIYGMKKNAGIMLNDMQSISKYSSLYLAAFEKCERYFWCEPWGNVVKYIPQSFDFILENFPKPKIDTLALDVFHSINREPWTLALRGKRILIISPFKESFEEKIAIREKIYGIDLFPDCEFVFIKPPQTQADNPSRPFDVELNIFLSKLESIKDTFDIALCSCGGYGNLVCSGLYNMGKSAIYVGGVLQMYFGIYGERWMRDRPDIMKLYYNKYWSRPKLTERPKGFQTIEGGCYW